MAILFALGALFVWAIGDIFVTFTIRRIGNASLVGTISGTFSPLVVVSSVIIFGESLNSYQILGIVAVISGVFLVSFRLEDIKRIEFSKDKGLVLREILNIFDTKPLIAVCVYNDQEIYTKKIEIWKLRV